MAFNSFVVAVANQAVMQALSSRLGLKQGSPEQGLLFVDGTRIQFEVLDLEASGLKNTWLLMQKGEGLVLRFANEENTNHPYEWSLFALADEHKESPAFYGDKLLVALLCSELANLMFAKHHAQLLAPENPTEQTPEQIGRDLFLALWQSLSNMESPSAGLMKLYRNSLLLLSHLLTTDYVEVGDALSMMRALQALQSGHKNDFDALLELLSSRQAEMQISYQRTDHAKAYKAIVIAAAVLLLMLIGLACFYGAGIAAGLWIGAQSFFTALSAANGLAIATLLCPVAVSAAGGGLAHRFFQPKPVLYSEMDALMEETGQLAAAV